MKTFQKGSGCGFHVTKAIYMISTELMQGKYFDHKNIYVFIGWVYLTSWMLDLAVIGWTETLAQTYIQNHKQHSALYDLRFFLFFFTIIWKWRKSNAMGFFSITFLYRERFIIRYVVSSSSSVFYIKFIKSKCIAKVICISSQINPTSL